MITIYPQEIKDGISELVKANASVAYVSQLMKNESLDDKVLDQIATAASVKSSRNIDRMDLYPIKTILVTTGCNKNLDIFAKEPTWEARFSAEDKPFNFLHNQTDIIGHIIDNFVIDNNGKLVDANADINVVPDKFHIVTPAVIYKFWENQAQQDRINKLISEIENENKWFVSMECLFANFDYGIMFPDGTSKIIIRNHETAGLTKFLRQYGGPGVIDGNYVIGRLLRKITFSGKGLVDNPANPESIIFNNVKTFSASSIGLGYINITRDYINNLKGKSVMAEKELLSGTLIQVPIEENTAFKMLKSENERLNTAVADLTKKLSETNSQATSDRINSLEKENASLKSKLEEVSTKLTKSEVDYKKVEAEKDEVKKDFSKMKEEKTKAERVSLLVSLKASKEEAEKIVADFVNLSDEQFASMASLIQSKFTSNAGSAEEYEKKAEEEYKKASKSKSEKEEETDNDTKAEKVVEEAKAEVDANLGVTNVDISESTRASIAEWYTSKVKSRTKKD